MDVTTTSTRMVRDLSIILPAYNEAENIETSISAALSWLDQAAQTDAIQYGEVIVVDDGSADDTSQRVRNNPDPRVRLVRHFTNLGYGAALRSGFQASKYNHVFFTDADLQFRLTDLHQLIHWAHHYDIVAGYRADRADPWNRRLNAWGWNYLINSIFGLQVRDIDCAFKLLPRRLFDSVGISSTGAFVNSELLVRAQAAGFRIKQVPVAHYPRLKGRATGARLSVIGRAWWELATLYTDLPRDPHGSRLSATP